MSGLNQISNQFASKGSRFCSRLACTLWLPPYITEFHFLFFGHCKGFRLTPIWRASISCELILRLYFRITQNEPREAKLLLHDQLYFKILIWYDCVVIFWSVDGGRVGVARGSWSCEGERRLFGVGSQKISQSLAWKGGLSMGWNSSSAIIITLCVLSAKRGKL